MMYENNQRKMPFQCSNKPAPMQTHGLGPYPYPEMSEPNSGLLGMSLATMCDGSRNRSTFLKSLSRKNNNRGSVTPAAALPLLPCHATHSSYGLSVQVAS